MEGLMKIANSTVLVTGANRGIGRAFVDALLERGAARVYATARDTRTPRQIPDDRVMPLALDVTSDEQIGAVATQIPRLDLLINNAGVLIPDDVVSGDLNTIQHQLDVNYLGPLKVTRAFLPLLERSGGAVVNVLSLVALASMSLTPAYSSSKAAAFSMTQALRAQIGRRGVAVHAVFPGPVDTDMLRGVEIQKAAAADVARAVLGAVEAGEEDVFPDPMSREVSAAWHSGPIKALERRFAAFAEGVSQQNRHAEVAS
jgi:NAD(P)-dependent dehydrogenase (short-subunit alcohol dehydrogenase family)